MFWFCHSRFMLVEMTGGQSVNFVLLWQPSDCIDLFVIDYILCYSRNINMMMITTMMLTRKCRNMYRYCGTRYLSYCRTIPVRLLRLTLVTAVVGTQQQPSALNCHHLGHVTSSVMWSLDLQYMVSSGVFWNHPSITHGCQDITCQRCSQAYSH